MGNTPPVVSQYPSIRSFSSWAEAEKQSNEKLVFPHMARDLPHHIIERKLSPSCGRFSTTYRIRHVESGAWMVLKVLLLRPDDTHTWNSTTAAGIPSSLVSEQHQHFMALQQQPMEELKTLRNLSQPLEDNDNNDNLNGNHRNMAPFLSWTMGGFYIQNLLHVPIYLMRPHVYSTMAHRMVTRPFLLKEEKFWMVHQILSTMDFLHSKGICHGHFTSQNVGLTSWNWVVILDWMPSQGTGCNHHVGHGLPQEKEDPKEEKDENRNTHVTSTTSNHTRHSILRPVELTEDDPSDWIYFFQEHSSNDGGFGGGESSSSSSFYPTIHSSNATTSTSTTTSATSSSTTTAVVANAMTLTDGDKKCYLAPERFVKQKRNVSSTSTTTTSSSSSSKHPEESFLKSKHDMESSKYPCITPAMDIFSIGCVLMELFLNGEIVMDLGDLMEYRRNGGNIETHSTLLQRLKKIENSSMRAACKHMLHLDPKKRLTAGEYLKRLLEEKKHVGMDEDDDHDDKAKEGNRSTSFAPIPACHESVFFPLFRRIKSEVLSPDARIALAAIYYKQILEETVGVCDNDGATFFADVVGPTMMDLYQSNEQKCKSSSGTSPNMETKKQVPQVSWNPLKPNDPSATDQLLAETETLLRDIERNFTASVEGGDDVRDEEGGIENDVTGHIFAPHAFSNHKASPPSVGALTIFVQFILVTIRHTQRPSSKIVGLQLLLRCAKYSSDEVRLQRIVPTILSLLHDTDALVRASSISTLSHVMSMVEQFPPSDAQIFPQYILKRISHLISDPSVMVRLAFTESIADLAESALRFLDTSHAIKVYETIDEVETSHDSVSFRAVESAGSAFDGATADLLGRFETSVSTPLNTPSKSIQKNIGNIMNSSKAASNATVFIQSDYDRDLMVLQDIIAKWLISITTDTSEYSSVLKLAILEKIARLCHFFGSEGVMSCILPQILAFLNNRKDWQLRATLCRRLPSVCAVIGRAATEQFVLPCVETALIDDEDLVVSNALYCLASLVEAGLLTHAILCGLFSSLSTGTTKQGMLQKYSALLIYPSEDIRHAASSLFSACCRATGFPDDQVLILPIIKPFLRVDMERSSFHNAESIMKNLLPSIPLLKTNDDFKSILDVYVEDCRLSEDVKVILQENVLNYDQIRRKTKSSIKLNSQSTLRILRGKIKEDEKESLTIIVPNQKYAELYCKPIPKWYEEINQTSIHGSPEDVLPTLRTMSILSKVYGMTIVQPAHSGEPHHIMKGGVMTLDLGFDSFSEGDMVNEPEKLQRMVRTEESKVFIGATKGEWGSLSLIDPVSSDMTQLVSKIMSIDVPTIPPSLGSLQDMDGRLFSSHTSPVASQGKVSNDATRKIFDWKPKVDTLLCTSHPREHSGPVTRMAVSQDQSFFVSGSHDGTCKVFETFQLQENLGVFRSCATYENPGPRSCRVNDLSIIENSHSVASAHSDGTLHVWRVDMVSKESSDVSVSSTINRPSRVSGLTDIRALSSEEGEILTVSHFNTDSESIIMFSSQMGVIHSWDLRCSREPFTLSIRPEMGTITSMSVGSDRNWVVAGTNAGCMALWDLRFHKLVKAWTASHRTPIYKVSTTIATLGNDHEPHPYVIMSSGRNETSIYSAITGKCNKCFRVLDPSQCYVDRYSLPEDCKTLPQLDEIPLHSNVYRRMYGVSDAVQAILERRSSSSMVASSSSSVTTTTTTTTMDPHINAFTGRINSSSEPNHLITSGSDASIRYWDFTSASKCFTISNGIHGAAGTMTGSGSGTLKSVYEIMDANDVRNSLILCRPIPPSSWLGNKHMFSSSANHSSKTWNQSVVRPDNGHVDSILDIKKLEFPIPGLLSCSRDGMIHFWR